MAVDFSTANDETFKAIAARLNNIKVGVLGDIQFFNNFIYFF